MKKNIQLSKRLQTVVELVTKGKHVADVGCDHAYISIYMMEHQIANRVIAMDINKGPLERAAANIEKYGYKEQIETRLSDGLEALNPGEVDTVLIAGMGGPLMQKILLGKKNVIEQVDELVLQPQSEVRDTRVFVEQLGFKIIQEDMLIEDGKFYVMLKARRTTEPLSQKKEIYNLYGEYLLVNRHPVLKSYLEKEKRQIETIIDRLNQTPSEKSRKKQKDLEKDMAYCKEALTYYESSTNH